MFRYILHFLHKRAEFVKYSRVVFHQMYSICVILKASTSSASFVSKQTTKIKKKIINNYKCSIKCTKLIARQLHVRDNLS